MFLPLKTLSNLVCFVFLQVPFAVLQGEGVEYLGCADEAIIAISNYRLHIKFKDSVINVSANQQTYKHTEVPQQFHFCPNCTSVYIYGSQ